ncbi:hypothetical protein H310_00516 [Aphanomyces invadans]|uniref:CAP-Gly domain-containing protein n=2 Tax=Aphanomyces invadans TaxID=157072 RepID=A0A024UUE3_9STRA|nr:hypothetical protein H310_00516 [Aphanomyces invadans]ETW10146.1 hypothetical protein H310_00516 [Aphanomyces invadans]|eukprot:XP_008861557.1 hypothetical protein H310_00516 [Aphanomyces invadans]
MARSCADEVWATPEKHRRAPWECLATIGSRVIVSGGRQGMLRFLGPTEFAKGVWVGVELDTPEEGKSDGAVNGVRYFTCKPLCGLFTKPTQIQPEPRRHDVTISPPALAPRPRPPSPQHDRKRRITRRSLLRRDHAVTFMSVLFNPSLLTTIQHFQPGLFADLHPRFAEWRAFIQTHANFRYNVGAPLRYQRFFDSQMHVAQDLYLPEVSDPRFVLHVAIFEGDVHVVKRCARCQEHTISPQALTCAARFGHLDIVQFLHQLQSHTRHPALRGSDTTAVDAAAAHGHLAVVEYLLQHQYSCSTNAMDSAATRGHLDLVRFLHDHSSVGCTHVAMDGAAENGHLAIVAFLHFHRTEGGTIDAMDFATQNGHLDVVQFLHFHRAEGCSADALNWAAEAGNLDLVYFLHDHRHEGATTDAMDAAAQHGYLDIVEFLHENRSEGCTSAAMDLAAANGHMDVVEFLHVRRREGCTADALIWAAQNGHLDMVMFLWVHRGQEVRTHADAALRAAKRHDHTTISQYLEFQTQTR